MASDFYIHIADESVLEGSSFNNFDEVLRYFFCFHIGSPYFNPKLQDQDPQFKEKYDETWDIVDKTPSVFVGEVNWFSVTLNELFGEKDIYKDIPNPVLEISRLFADSELVLIDDEFISKVKSALELPNQTKLKLGDAAEIINFLETHKGKYCFSVSW